MNIGGIAGYSSRIDIDNCVNYGTFSSLETGEYKYLGNIVGECSNIHISHCYWNEIIIMTYTGFQVGP